MAAFEALMDLIALVFGLGRTARVPAKKTARRRNSYGDSDTR